MNNWPTDRPESYDSTLVYDEESSAWISKDGRGGSRFQNRVIVINELGNVYIGS